MYVEVYEVGMPSTKRMHDHALSHITAQSGLQCDAELGEMRCTVCLEAFATGDAVTGLTCGHPYHTECLRKWLCVSEHACVEHCDCPALNARQQFRRGIRS